MKCNVGEKDRILRFCFGLTLLLIGASGANWWMCLVGAVLVVTGLVRWCPAYLMLGITTKKQTPST